MKKFVLAGCGSRGYDMFARPLSEDFAGEAELVGVFDINPIRAKYEASNAEMPQFLMILAICFEKRNRMASLWRQKIQPIIRT